MNPDQNQDQNPEQTSPDDQPINQPIDQPEGNLESTEYSEPSPEVTSEAQLTSKESVEPVSPESPAPAAMTDPISPVDAPVVPTMSAPAEPLLPAETDPGKTLGIVGFILSFFVTVVGLILSIIGLVKSKKAGHKNPFALAGIIIGIVGTIIWVGSIIALYLAFLGSASSVVNIAQACSNQGNVGTVVVDGFTYTCGLQ